jgi:hypothetical protein
MIIQASDLKHKLKKLTPVKTETYVFNTFGICAQDSDVIVVVDGPWFSETFSVASKKLAGTVSRMSGDIDITRQGNKLILASAKARVELEVQTVKPKVFPESPDKIMTLDAKSLRRALAVATASASPAKSADFGGVVQLRSLPPGLESGLLPGYRVAGTDSLVLTVAEVHELVPFEFLSLLNLTAAGVVQIMDGDVIEFGDSDTCLRLKSGDTTVYASKPEKKYPNFDAHLAASPVVKFGFKSEELLAALRTVEPLIDESLDQGAVGLHFTPSVVYCSSIGVGSTAQDESACEQLDPDPVFDPQDLGLRLSGKYLSSFLSKAGENSTFGYRTKDDPVRLESDGVVVMMKTMVAKEKK